MKADVIKGMNGGGVTSEKGVRENGESLNKALTLNKLSEYLREWVCRMIGEYASNQEIVNWLKVEHCITVDSATISYYRRAEGHADAIQRARATYNASMDEQWSASSRNRLAKLEGLYRHAAKNPSKAERRGECQRILEQMQTECPGMAAMISDSTDLVVPEWAAEGLGVVKDKVTDSP